MSATATRLAAGLVAAALTVGLGTTSASAVDEPTGRTTKVPAVQPTPRPLTAGTLPVALSRRAAGATPHAGPDVTRIHVSNGLLFRKGANSVDLRLTIAPGTVPEGLTLDRVTFSLQVGTRIHRNVPLFYDDDERTYFLDTRSGWGAGPAKILNSRLTFSDGSSVMDGTDSNRFYLRNQVMTTAYYSMYVTVYDPGTRIRFEPKRWVVFRPSTGTYVSLGQIRLQIRRNGHWRSLKTIQLNRRGSGSYSTHVPGKHAFRLYVPRTSTVIGGVTPSTVF